MLSWVDQERDSRFMDDDNPQYIKVYYIYPIGSMSAIYGNIYHQYTPNVSIYTIHGSYGYNYSRTISSNTRGDHGCQPSLNHCPQTFVNSGRLSSVHTSRPGIKINGGTVPYKAIFYGDVPLHRPYIGLIYGRYLQFRILKIPLIWLVNYPLVNAYITMERSTIFNG